MMSFFQRKIYCDFSHGNFMARYRDKSVCGIARRIFIEVFIIPNSIENPLLSGRDDITSYFANFIDFRGR